MSLWQEEVVYFSHLIWVDPTVRFYRYLDKKITEVCDKYDNHEYTVYTTDSIPPTIFVKQSEIIEYKEEAEYENIYKRTIEKCTEKNIRNCKLENKICSGCI